MMNPVSNAAATAYALNIAIGTKASDATAAAPRGAAATTSPAQGNLVNAGAGTAMLQQLIQSGLVHGINILA